MFVGHYGVSFALKPKAPRVPLWVWFIAVQWLDVVWSVLVLLGIERLRIVPSFTQANALDLYYMPYTHGLAGALALSLLLGAVVALAQPWPFALVIDNVLGDHHTPAAITTIAGSSQNDLIVSAVATSIAIVVFTSVIGMIGTYVDTRLEQDMALEFRTDLFAHCERLSQAYHDQRTLGDFIYRIGMAGYRIRELPEALVLHDSRPRGTWLFYYQIRNRWHFMLKNYQWRTLLLITPCLLIHEPLQLAVPRDHPENRATLGSFGHQVSAVMCARLIA